MNRLWTLLLLTWVIALVATSSALFLGEVMGMTPCVLCWYQRIAMFPLVAILGVACYNEDRRGAVYALPLALAGVALAGYHTLLVAGLIPKAWIPCSAGGRLAPALADVFVALVEGVLEVQQRGHQTQRQDCSLFPLLVRVFTFCFLRLFNFLGFRLCV